jgi:CheY-like chemotaxis protein
MSPEELLADLRHRLRTPLNHIIGYSELLLEDGTNLDPDSSAQLRTIRANAHLILSQIQHRLSPDEDHAPKEKIAGLRSDIAEPLDLIIGNAGQLSQRLRGPDLLDLLRINAASMDLFWFAQGNDIAGRVFASPHRPLHPGPVPVFAQPSRLLVVDDDETNCDVLNRQLARSGHSVTCVGNGVAALVALREDTFDLVLLDVVMPGMSGFEVLQELKADRVLSRTPVIMMSALDELESAAHCIQMASMKTCTGSPLPLRTICRNLFVPWFPRCSFWRAIFRALARTNRIICSTSPWTGLPG